ncbi:MAG: hypothetical protein HYZ65_03335 [Burkholderiales bacterium]|nr:hypothetical protein [Burkholderiales bacterium]
MKHLLAVLFASVSLMSGATALACDQEEHQEHHTQGAAATQGTAPASMVKMDQQMKMMRDMHERMMGAKSAEERSGMMAGHMKAMQAGMAMMDDMRAAARHKMKGKLPAAMLEQHQMMEQRMDMMQSMMQMMMDRLPAAAQ